MPQCHWLHACIQRARATYDRTYVDRLRVRSIDRSIKKNLRQPLPPATAAAATDSEKAERKSSSFPNRAVRVLVLALVRLVRFTSAPLSLSLMTRTRRRSGESGSQPLQVASRRLPLERMRLNKAAELATAKPMEE